MHTRRSNTICTVIDHIITDNPCRKFVLYTGDTYLSDHRFLLLNINANLREQMTSKIKIIDYNRLKNSLLSFDLNNSSFEIFHERLINSVKFKEQKITKNSSNYKKPWFREELKPYLKYRDAFYKLKIKYPGNDYYKEQFTYYKDYCEKNIENDKITHNSNKLKSNLNNPKKLWPVELMCKNNRNP
jgi:hypothetical protein